MSFSPNRNEDVFCYLKAALEPEYQVTAHPVAGYFAQQRFCYRVWDGRTVRHELSGDFRTLKTGELVCRATRLVSELGGQKTSHLVHPESHAHPSSGPDIRIAGLPSFASRLPPKRYPMTWFSSGRAAFAFLITEIACPRIIYLPTFVCWSLVDTVQQHFPDVELRFYAVRITESGDGMPSSGVFRCEYPEQPEPDSAVVCIHYFGHKSALPAFDDAILLEDRSHCRPPSADEKPTTHQRHFVFGSLRKLLRVADGGFVSGQWDPIYAADQKPDTWLRLVSQDWRDLREAENMMDRYWSVSDISSQSLATVLTTDYATTGRKRQDYNRILNNDLTAGRPLLRFREDECPLLHCRVFDSTSERDSLREYLMRQDIFTSIHWPVHPAVLSLADHVEIESAVWMQDRTIAIPISEDFSQQQMENVCDVAREWQQAGTARFPVCHGR